MKSKPNANGQCVQAGPVALQLAVELIINQPIKVPLSMQMLSPSINLASCATRRQLLVKRFFAHKSSAHKQLS